MENIDDKQFVLSRIPDATCEKLFEHDDVTYDYAVIQPYNSYVMGSGKTEESAWTNAAINIRIKEARHRELTSKGSKS